MFDKVKLFFSKVKEKVSSINDRRSLRDTFETKVPNSVKRNPNVEFDFTEEGVKVKEKILNSISLKKTEEGAKVDAKTPSVVQTPSIVQIANDRMSLNEKKK